MPGQVGQVRLVGGFSSCHGQHQLASRQQVADKTHLRAVATSSRNDTLNQPTYFWQRANEIEQKHGVLRTDM